MQNTIVGNNDVDQFVEISAQGDGSFADEAAAALAEGHAITQAELDKIFNPQPVNPYAGLVPTLFNWVASPQSEETPAPKKGCTIS